MVTLTTVGFGDITPVSAFGKFLASLIMLMGYGLIAVPTGIFSAELAHATLQQSNQPGSGASAAITSRTCGACGADGHESDARFCRRCGASLDPS